MTQDVSKDESISQSSSAEAVERRVIIMHGLNKVKHRFAVREDLLFQKSRFFEHLLREAAENTDDGSVSMPTSEVEVMKVLFDWVESDHIKVPDLCFERAYEKENASRGSIRGPFGFLAQLWLVAERYGMPSLQNDAIDGFAHLHLLLGTVPYGIISWIYEQTHTHPNSQLRLFMVDILARYLSPEGLAICKSKLSLYGEEVIYDLAELLLKRRALGKLAETSMKYEDCWSSICSMYHEIGCKHKTPGTCKKYKGLVISEKWASAMAKDPSIFAD